MPNDEKYYTPEEVEQLTDKQLADNTTWENVKKSMEKWGDNNAE